MLIDTHCHLHVKEFDADRDGTIERAAKAHVKMICVGFEPEGNRAAAELAVQLDTFWTAGIHPHSSDLATPENLNEIRKLAASPYGKLLKALGEMGLDYFRNLQPTDTQKSAFKSQLLLAKELDLPVIVHCRDAFDDAFEMLFKARPKNAVFHCYTGTLEQAKKIWDLGYLTSFTGILTYPSASEMRKVAAAAPVNQIMIESDCPYLAPQSKRGKQNEPSFLVETFETLCKIRATSPNLQQKQLQENTERFFGVKF